MTDSAISKSSQEKQSGFVFRWGPRILFAVLFSLFLYSKRYAPPLEGWGNSFEQAVAQAGESDRNLVVAFTQSGCAPCEYMKRAVLNTSEVQTALKDYVPAEIDVMVNTQLAIRYDVFATPAYAIVASDGKLLAKIEGVHSPEEFVRFLQINTQNKK